MAQVELIIAKLDEARAAIEADKAEIIAEIQRLGLPDEDIQPVLDKIATFGSILDDVPGVSDEVPETPEEPAAPEEPVEA